MYRNDLFKKVTTVIRALTTRKLTLTCDAIPYHFSRVPLRKIVNWIAVEMSLFVKPDRPWGWPTRLQIEPSTFCNLRCAICPVTEGMARKTEHMELSTFKKIIDETGDYVFLIFLWDWGEPFLNPKIYDMIKYAKSRNIKIVSSTNGHIFTADKHAERLISSGIDTIIFAIDGITQETYARYRGGGQLEQVLSGLRKVVAAKQKAKSDGPLINFRFLVTRQNEHELADLPRFAQSYGVDSLTIKTLNPYCSGIDMLDERAWDFIPESEQFRRFRYPAPDRLPGRRIGNPCRNPWFNPTIHCDGTICPCTFDTDGSMIFGDINKASFQEIWHDRPYRSFRRQFRKDYQAIKLCSDCSLAFGGGFCGVETIAETYFFKSRK
ncbi:radical SAM protein [candidate division CSSED10-310 bacterium]|uniref:Radical SAM protein n=1 Tax=candidate division CSSED10-310 bacterium TaxID=2855610 RepID=A0ABV6Z2I3_UNCC1